LLPEDRITRFRRLANCPRGLSRRRLRHDAGRIAGSTERDIARINASGRLARNGNSGHDDVMPSQSAEQASVSAIRRRLTSSGTTGC
jgi:hypothetical protein